ncbi:TPA: hypothetical protein ACXHWU_002278 [Morganella morganii]
MSVRDNEIWFAQNQISNNLFSGITWSYIRENKTIRLANSIGSDSIILTTVHLPAHGNNFSGFASSFDYGAKWINTTVSHQHFISPALSGGGEMMPANLTQSGPANTMTARRGTIAILSQSERIHTISGVTGNTGSGSSVAVVKTYIMRMNGAGKLIR